MTFKDLLDQVVHGSGDDTAAYRTAVLRWLNLARSEVADMALWRSAFNGEATFTTNAATTSGIYTLSGYESISGDYLYDLTSNAVVRHESFEVLNGIDPTKDTISSPTYWADAGMSSAGIRQIYLWPVPSAAYTIRFAGYRLLTDITAAQENLETDPYFGPLAPWGAAFAAGIRFYEDQDDNQDANQSMLSRAAFDRLVRMRMRRNSVGNATIVAHEVRAIGQVAVGRFDPSHYNNRG